MPAAHPGIHWTPIRGTGIMRLDCGTSRCPSSSIHAQRRRSPYDTPDARCCLRRRDPPPNAVLLIARELATQPEPSPAPSALTLSSSTLQVGLLSLAIIAIIASLASLRTWMSGDGIAAKQGFFDYLVVYIAGLAAVTLLVYHATKVIKSESPSLLELLGEVSVVLIVWFFFIRLHTVGKLTDAVEKLVNQITAVGATVNQMAGQTTGASKQLQNAQNDLQSGQEKLDSSINNLIAATEILDKQSIAELDEHNEKSEWFHKLKEVRVATVQAYFNATRGSDLKRPLIRSTFFTYFDQVTTQLKNQLVFATTLDVHAQLVFELGKELRDLAKRENAMPVMCFGNVFSIARFFNTKSDFKSPPSLGHAIDFIDHYGNNLTRLRKELGIEQYPLHLRR